MFNMQLRHYIQALGAILPIFVSTANGQLSPWLVTGLQTWQPSGRPGNSPDWYVHVNLTNPNPDQSVLDANDTQSSVYCEVVWQYPNVPYNQIVNCEVAETADSVLWAWTAELLEATDPDPYPTTNFDLRWRASPIVLNQKDEYLQIWTGTAQFEVAKNMQGTCAASGFCLWVLKPEDTPVSVEIDTVTCWGSLGEALHGINCNEEAD
ncbi:hypothetical protein F5Y12DRAFT_414534 [Xylaria sp. FL1777]|nr:hypothetical protein F5Y12DRAFT_414534 [Xylaria sp. FL1777]